MYIISFLCELSKSLKLIWTLEPKPWRSIGKPVTNTPNDPYSHARWISPTYVVINTPKN